MAAPAPTGTTPPVAAKGDLLPEHAAKKTKSTLMSMPTDMANKELDMAKVLAELNGRTKQTMTIFRPADGHHEAIDWNATGEEQLTRTLSAPSLCNLLKYTENMVNNDMRKTGTDKHALLRVVLDDEYQCKTCMALPLTLIFFAVFAGVFQIHYGISYVHLQEQSIRNGISNQAADLSSPVEIFDWMENTFFPFMWSPPNVPGSSVEHAINSGTHNQKLIAGVMVRTARGPTEMCADELVSDMECFPEAPRVRSSDPVFNGWDSSRRLQVQDEDSGTWLGWVTDFLYRKDHSFTTEWVRHDTPVERLARQKAKKHIRRSTRFGRFGRWGYGPAKNSTRAALHKRRLQQGLRAPPRRVSTNREHKAPRSNVIDEVEDGLRFEEVEDSNHGRRLKLLNSQLKDSLPHPWAGKNAYMTVVPMSMTPEQVSAQIAKWKEPDSLLITKSTSLLQFEGMLMNEELGSGVVSQVFVNFLFSRGGTIYSQIVFQSLILETQSFVWFGLFLWMIMLVGISIITPFRAMVATKKGEGCSHFLNAANFFEWVLIIYGWFMVLLLITERMGMLSFSAQWDEYITDRVTASSETIVDFDKSWFKKMEKRIYDVGALDGYVQVLVADYHIVLILRFILASKGHPRLAMVVNTMQQGLTDIVHLIIVFVIIFSAYVMSGHILFGHRMEEFATIKGSLGYCLQIVLQREYQWRRFTAQDFVTVTIWVWSFMIIVVLVVVNIVLAMIFDNYGDVRMAVTVKDTVWDTGKQLITQLRLLSVWISNSDLVTALSRVPDTKPVNVALLRQICPGISSEQVSHLFETAKMRLVNSIMKGNKNMLPEAIASILLSVDDLRQGVRMMNTQSAPQSAPPIPEEEGEEVNNTPPDTSPYWVDTGLLRHLQKQQGMMDQMYLQMKQIEDLLKDHGVGVKCAAVPVKPPPEPDRSGSARLDPSLSGHTMKPMLTPGCNRAGNIVNIPRSRIIASGTPLSERLRGNRAV